MFVNFFVVLWLDLNDPHYRKPMSFNFLLIFFGN